MRRVRDQILKIDQSIVRDMHADPDGRVIVAAIIAQAHGMNLKVVAAT